VDRSTAAALGKPELDCGVELFSRDNSQMRWLSRISNRSVRLLRLMVSARQAGESVASWFKFCFPGHVVSTTGWLNCRCVLQPVVLT